MRKLVLVSLVSCHSAVAVPLARRADDGGIPSATWVPIVVVVIAILLAATASIIQRRRHRRAVAAVSTATGNNTTREITADQLTGQNASTTPANGTNSANPPRTRRPRRNRRTPSQISTKSLPAYNPDAGEQELVIYRAPDENLVIPEGESPRPSMDTYGAVPRHSTSTPLIGEHDENEPRVPPGVSRPSVDTLVNSDESSQSLLRDRQSTDEPDPRGEAPPYSEIPLNDEPGPANLNRRMSSLRRFLGSNGNGNNSTSTSTHSPTFANVHTRTPSSPPRPSLSVPNAPSSPPVSNIGHTRGASSTSTVASGSVLSRITSRPSHRPSHSGGSSFFSRSFHHLRPSSPGAGDGHLPASPSLISLNSISAPLSHTLTRTDIQFPAGGPTPDQVRLLASRESLFRFGVPYGADAVAFASASRIDVAGLPPPPNFESIVSADTSASAAQVDGLPNADSTSPQPNSSSDVALDSNFASVPSETERQERATAAASTSTLVEDTSTATAVTVPTITESPPAISTPASTSFRIPSPAPLLPPIRADSALSAASFTTALDDSDDPTSRRMSMLSTASFATARESIAGASIAPTTMNIAVEGPTPTGSRAPSMYDSDSGTEEEDVTQRRPSPVTPGTESTPRTHVPVATPAVVIPKNAVTSSTATAAA